jgi:hypothetical protein
LKSFEADQRKKLNEFREVQIQAREEIREKAREIRKEKLEQRIQQQVPQTGATAPAPQQPGK